MGGFVAFLYSVLYTACQAIGICWFGHRDIVIITITISCYSKGNSTIVVIQKYTPVEPRPCSREALPTHWGSHVGSHKDGHHQNYSPPTVDLQPTSQVQEMGRESERSQEKEAQT